VFLGAGWSFVLFAWLLLFGGDMVLEGGHLMHRACGVSHHQFIMGVLGFWVKDI
jgi:hypothetical protein